MIALALTAALLLAPPPPSPTLVDQRTVCQSLPTRANTAPQWRCRDLTVVWAQGAGLPVRRVTHRRLTNHLPAGAVCDQAVPALLTYRKAAREAYAPPRAPRGAWVRLVLARRDLDQRVGACGTGLWGGWA